MKYKLIDVRTEVEENVEFGTCELCMSVGTLHREIIVLEDEYGKIHEVETGEWDWGDYMTLIEIENVVDFAAWLSKQDIIVPYMNTRVLWNLVDDYKEEIL